MKNPAYILTTVFALLGILAISTLVQGQNNGPRQASVQWQWEAAQELQSSADQSNNVLEQLRQQLISQGNGTTSSSEVTTEQLPNGMTKALLPVRLMHTVTVRRTADGKFIFGEIKGPANAATIANLPEHTISE